MEILNSNNYIAVYDFLYMSVAGLGFVILLRHGNDKFYIESQYIESSKPWESSSYQ